MIAVNFDQIPRELQAERRWVVWRKEMCPDKATGELKPTKVPYQAGSPNYNAASTRPKTWGTFAQARAAYEHGRCDGIGFVLGDGYAGADFDHCRDEVTGEIAANVLSETEAIASYAEVSASGTGVHVLLRGELPPGSRHKNGPVEVYSEKRYFTMTGMRLDGAPATVEARQEELKAFCARNFPAKLLVIVGATSRAASTLSLDDESVLSKANASDAKFARLMDGDTSGYPSASEARAALCFKLAFWTGRDATQMDRLFRRSGLMSEKWDSWRGAGTLGDQEIARALAGVSEGYTPRISRVEVTTENTEMPRPVPPTTLPCVSEAPARVEWDDPAPLPSGLPPVLPLDPAIIPEALRPWIEDVAERMQVPLDFLAPAAIVVAGALIGRRVGIHPKQYDDWLEIPNLWGVLVGESGAMKSHALGAMVEVIERLEHESAADFTERLAAYEEREREAEAQKCAIRDELKKLAKQRAQATVEKAKAKAPAADGAGPDEATIAGQEQALRDLLATVETPEKPTQARYMTNDTTIEKLAELLIESHKGMAIFRDELMALLRTMEKQGHETDRAFYLEAWPGNRSYNFDRIGRGSRHVPALCISILGGIQPGPFAGYVYEATAGGVGSDGFLPRFQLLVWPDTPRHWENVDRWPDTDAKNRAYRSLKALVGLAPARLGIETPEDPHDVPALRFDREAQDLFNEWRAPLERRVRSGELAPALQSHLAKYRGLMPSLALIFHLLDVVDDAAEDPGHVSASAAERAIAWCEYLESHAMRVYAAAADPETERARALFAHLEAGDIADGTPMREVYRRQWSRLSTPDEVESAVAMLEKYGWVKRVKDKPATGRPSDILRLHPRLTEPKTGPGMTKTA